MQALKGTLKALGEALRANRGLRVSVTLALVLLLAMAGAAAAIPALLGHAPGEPEAQEQAGADAPEEPEFEHHDYTGSEQALMDTLTGCSWQSQAGSVVTFAGDWAEVTDASGSRKVAVELRNASVGKPQTSTREEAGEEVGYVTSETDFVLVWDEEPYPSRLTTVTSDGSASYALETEPLGALSGVTASASLEIEDDPAGLSEAVLGHESGLREALVEWCSTHAPSATRATWSGEATRDWVSGLVSVSLTLNDPAKTTVTATMDADAGTFHIRG